MHEIYTCVRKKHSVFLVYSSGFSFSDCSRGCRKCENPAYRLGYKNKYREIHTRNRLCHRIFALPQRDVVIQLRAASSFSHAKGVKRAGVRSHHPLEGDEGENEREKEKKRASNGFSPILRRRGRYFREKSRLGIRPKVPNYPRNTIPGKFLRRNSEPGVTRFARHRFRTTSKVSILKGRSPILSLLPRVCLRSIRNSTIEMTELLSWERKRNARIGGTNGSHVVQLPIAFFFIFIFFNKLF